MHCQILLRLLCSLRRWCDILPLHTGAFAPAYRLVDSHSASRAFIPFRIDCPGEQSDLCAGQKHHNYDIPSSCWCGSVHMRIVITGRVWRWRCIRNIQCDIDDNVHVAFMSSGNRNRCGVSVINYPAITAINDERRRRFLGWLTLLTFINHAFFSFGWWE